MAETYFIEEVAVRTGLTARTLRFWEEKGLLPPPCRTEGGLRSYCEADVARIERVRDLKEALGLSLDLTRDLIAAETEIRSLRDKAHQLSSPTDRLPLLHRAIGVMEAQIHRIVVRESRLAQLRQEYEQHLQRFQDRVHELTGPDIR